MIICIFLLIYTLGGKQRTFNKILFIILICLEKGQKFWKSQGKIREFHQEEKVGTLLIEFSINGRNLLNSGKMKNITEA